VLLLCAALLLFVIVYLLLVGVCAALAMGAGFVGFLLISERPSFFTIMIYLGLIGMGLMVVAFLLKFLFARSTPDESMTIEITESDEPQLVDFVRKIAAEAAAPVPKRIILGPEVNAAVFFESSLLSMILPVRKNLRIGLGIVNVLTLSEFKAVLAHEFGHFSQKSMRLGSYAYGANRIVYNMLFENTSYGEMLNRWASVSNYFKFFAGITVWIVRGIQEVMKRIFAVVQASYMALSREMEFHADAVAASIAGSRPFVTMLHRLTPADICFSALTGTYHAWSPEMAKPDNAFAQHRELLLEYAKDHEIPIEHGLPQATLSSRGPWIKFRISAGNRWASHPSPADREAHVNSLRFDAEPSYQSAWVLFKDPMSMQARMTAMMFPDEPGAKPAKVIDAAGFLARRSLGFHSLQVPHPFKEYFAGGRVEPLDVEAALALVPERPAGGISEILTEAALRLPAETEGLGAETRWLKELVAGRIDVPSFDFDGAKFRAKDAPELLERLERELKDKQGELARTDERLFCYFLSRAGEASKAEECLTLVREYAAQDVRSREFGPLASEIGEKVNFLSRIEPKDIAAGKTVAELRECDQKLAGAIRGFLAVDREGMMASDIRAVLEEYLGTSRVYITSPMPAERAPVEKGVEEECPECHATVRPATTVCPACGAGLHEGPTRPETVFVCSKCGTAVKAGEGVCPSCGEDLTWESDDRSTTTEKIFHCLACGTEVGERDEECPHCGRALLREPGDIFWSPSTASELTRYEEKDFKILNEAVFAAARVGPPLVRVALKRILDFQGALAALPGRKPT
jgi:Zn-dependent protease with chaperone function/DNA-directed RNA polymerase subunit M/transcription elongation factor TFIIS